MASTSLTRTVSSTGSLTTGTLSMWFKRTTIDAEQYLFENYETSGNRIMIRLLSSNQINLEVKQGNATKCQMNTSGMFRDPNAWYHVVFAMDSSQATASNRLKVYINGVLQTSFTDITYPSSQNQNMSFNEGNPTYVTIGRQYGASNYFDGLMSHVHWIDGTQYAASDFGETDSTTGQWKIKTSPSVTYGTNGFFILKDGNSVTDQSGQSNNFTVAAGTLTSTKDCPSNVYCVWNRLVRQTGDMDTVGNGNTYLATQNDNTWRSAYGTIGFQGTGKFYAEFKCGNLGGTQHLGIVDVDQQNANNGSKFSDASRAYAYANNGQKVAAGSQSSYGNSWDSGAYLQIAYNNGAIWFGKDGTWQNSATISEINAGTTTNATFTGIDTSKTYTIGWNGYADDMIELNAGNGWFRTTEVGSPNNPSSGDTGAKFKYTVPTGYQPLSTKGLNE